MVIDMKNPKQRQKGINLLGAGHQYTMEVDPHLDSYIMRVSGDNITVGCAVMANLPFYEAIIENTYKLN